MREETKRIPGGSVTDDGKSEDASTSDEAGEPSHGTPQSKGASRVTEPREGKAPGQEAPISVDTKLARIATRARERPQEVITNINHFIDIEWMKEAHRRTRKDGASGVDRVTAEDYAATIYNQVGIDPNKTLITPGGRPQYIVKDGHVVKELLA